LLIHCHACLFASLPLLCASLQLLLHPLCLALLESAEVEAELSLAMLDVLRDAEAREGILLRAGELRCAN
jgi:hypothetical protein